MPKTAAEANAERIEAILTEHGYMRRLTLGEIEMLARKIVEAFPELRGANVFDPYKLGIHDRALGKPYNRLRVLAEHEDEYRAGWSGAERPAG